MTERDSDIEFDFFEEPETREAARPERPPQRGGPRPPLRTPQGFTPLLRLIGLIAFAIVIVVLLVYAIEGCQSSSKKSKYEGYMSHVSGIARDSQQVGRRLATTLLTPGTKPAELQTKLAGLARDQEQAVEAARAIDPPGRLRSEHERMIDALEYRYSGIVGVASALTRALSLKTGAGAGAGKLLEPPAQRLLASDVVWDDSFRVPSNQVMKQQGVGDVQAPDSNFVQDPTFYTEASLNSVVGRLKGGSVKPAAGGLHGTNIVSTKALPQGTELSTSNQQTVIASTSLKFEVAIKDSGNSPELNIPVTLTIQQSPTPIVKHAKLDFINPGQEKTVTFKNIGAVQFTTPTKVKVAVSPVPGEHNTSNNSSEYPVIFSLPGG
jgi:hypothetical protein